MKNSKGFTLIELLVVIAIIGILSSIVLASLNTARGKGTNAAVQTSIAQLRTQTNLYYNDFGNYGTASANGSAGSCSTLSTVFTDSKVKILVSQIQSNTGNTAICSNNTGALGSWTLSAKLPQSIGANKYVCTDANSVTRYGVASPGNVTSCPASF
jgi:prepilin-type N-terminal cleavage/methylation domain-containing protein